MNDRQLARLFSEQTRKGDTVTVVSHGVCQTFVVKVMEADECGVTLMGLTSLAEIHRRRALATREDG